MTDANVAKLLLFDSRELKDATYIGEKMKHGASAIINISKLTDEKKTRLLDFLSGVNYVLEGKVRKIEDNSFLFVAKNTMMEELEGSDLR